MQLRLAFINDKQMYWQQKMSDRIVYSVPWTYKQITIELRYNYKTIPVPGLWMAEDVPSFGSQSKRAKIATHLFAQKRLY